MGDFVIFSRIFFFFSYFFRVRGVFEISVAPQGDLNRMV